MPKGQHESQVCTEIECEAEKLAFTGRTKIGEE